MTKQQERQARVNMLTLKGLIESEIEHAKHMIAFYEDKENEDSDYMLGAWRATKEHLNMLEIMLKYTTF